MARNIEIKARIQKEQVEYVRQQAQARSSTDDEQLHQVDTFYNVPSGRLKLRESANGTAELIAYKRSNQAGPKLSSYVRYLCTDSKTLHDALARSVGIRGVVKKTRQVIHVSQTRVHIDEVDGLGTFLELEVVLCEGQSSVDGKNIASELMKIFGVLPESLVDRSYIDLLEESNPK
jgi:predicted adenylyl cyclase CyaB